MAEYLDEKLENSKYIYYLQQNIVCGECSFIIITNIEYKIVRIITPYAECGYANENLVVNNINCDVCDKKHSVGELYEWNECIYKLPYEIKKFTDANKLLEYISDLYRGCNPGKWAGNALRIDSDEDMELYGLYEDSTTGKIYGGWVSTHKTWDLQLPKTLKFNNTEDINDEINVLLEDDTELGKGLKISYKGHTAYSSRSLANDIYNRIWHLLLVDNASSS
jgi:hypothetical protein